MGGDKIQGSELPATPKPRRPSRHLIAVALPAVMAGAVLGGTGVWLSMRGHRAESAHAAPAAKTTPRYQCPMHPAITSDQPGDCPICGMKLVLRESAASEGSGVAKPGARKIALYRSPMDPKQTSPVPRKDEMGMDYVPVYDDELAGGTPVQGLATVSIDPARQQLIGLRTVAVTKGSVAATWRAPARVQVDPKRVRQTNVKVEGFVERIYVDFVGQAVRKGQPLFSLYSPSLLAAQNEYLLALQTSEALAKGGTLSGNGDTLVAAARRRLDLWDVPAAEIERLARTRQPTKALTMVSPIAGVVTTKNVVQGTRVNPGEAPYEITDLGEVWVMADAYESDLGRIQVGMKATLTLPAYPNRSFWGQVAFIDPVLDPKTRTLKVHLHFANPKRELKPEMYGEVELQGAAQEGLRIPADAVIRSGTRDVVFLARGEGRFEPRVVQLGNKSGADVEVTSGLEDGQEVVTRANFLVDSESQLRASLSAIGGK
ncbi:MAG: efflux RND transporter periplasmic adaptor subunit [Polyangia bacterium]